MLYLLTCLLYGDGGKGTTTHWLTKYAHAHTVIRTGGPQAFHAVETASGQKHIFSQFGSGTLLGARTHLSSNMVIEPYKLLKEGRLLRDDCGIHNVFDLITLDRDALVITPFQAIANRLWEIDRGENPHGTVGIGVGEAVLDSEVIGDLAIRVKDFCTPGLRDKLAAIREMKLRELQPVIERIESLPGRAHEELKKLQNEKIVDWATEEFNYVREVIEVVDGAYLGEILRMPGNVIFEPSQGVLLDRWYGWNPYTTMARPMPEAANELLEAHDYQEEVTRLGILRAYSTRHGAGPFVTWDSQMSEELPDPNNPGNEWQGSFRVGSLDAVALKYAIDACGGPQAFDGLVVTCLDQMYGRPDWQICDAYQPPVDEPELESFFRMEGGEITGIKIRQNTLDQAQLDRQEELGRLLFKCKPILTEIGSPKQGSPNAEIHKANKRYLREIQDRLEIPAVLTSLGPTEADKIEITPCNTTRILAGCA